MISDAKAQAKIDELVGRLGKFEAHNIQLSNNVYTIGKDSVGGHGRHGRFIALATSLYGADLTGLKVLDLACLEGITAIEFARRGATTVGVEIRDHHLDKARGVAKILGLKKASFVTDDIRNVTPEKFGKFDIVICSGILYHLDEPDVFKVVNNIAACCTRLLVIDTSTSLVGRKKVEYNGVNYFGRYAMEHIPGDDAKTKKDRTWASIDNEKSYYLTRASLINLMANSGVSCVSELKMPFKYKDGHPRTTFYGFKAPADVSLAGTTAFAEGTFQLQKSPNQRIAPRGLDVETMRAELRKLIVAQRRKKA